MTEATVLVSQEHEYLHIVVHFTVKNLLIETVCYNMGNATIMNSKRKLSAKGEKPHPSTLILPPRLVAETTLFSAFLPEGNQICNSGSYSDFVLSGHTYSDQIADHVSFDRVHFRGVALSRTQLTGLGLSDVRLEECDLANAVWHKSVFHRVEILGCRMIGLRVNEAFIKNSLVKDCNGSLAQFRFSAFKNVRFEKCNLRGADFQEADLRGVAFVDCDLREAEMSFANLDGTDFRGTDIDGLRVGIENLKGAIVDPFQAAYLARLIGLKVELPR